MRLLLLTAVLALTFSATAHACSCIGASNPKKEIRKSKGAAWVKVVKKTVKRGDERFMGDEEAVYRLRILRDYKGNLRRHVTIRTSLQSASCGLNLRRGQKLGLLFYRQKGRLASNLCLVRSRKYLEQGKPDARSACAQR